MTLTIKNGTVIIDDTDYNLVGNGQYNWYVDKSGYVVAWLPDSRSFLRMHNFILGYNGPLDVDHINRIKHDNRRANLRIVEHYVNLHNSKIRTDNTNGHRGVFLNRSGNFGFQVWIKGKKYAKQGFKTMEEASAARTSFLKGKI